VNTFIGGYSDHDRRASLCPKRGMPICADSEPRPCPESRSSRNILAFVSLVTMRWTEPSIVEGIEDCCQAGRLGRCQIANSNWRNDQGTDE
jgi:hypothetical protein